jgi:hypothetical protein
VSEERTPDQDRPTPDQEEYSPEPPGGEDPQSPEPGPSGEESTDFGTPAEHESEVVAPPEGYVEDRKHAIPPPREGTDRVLIFLNEVAGGRRLLQAARERGEAGASFFAVVAPQNQPIVGQVIDEGEIREAAQSRVDVTQAVLSEFGIESVGAVMDPDPPLALDDAVRATQPDEILLSCLLETRFGLLRRDLIEWATSRYEDAEVIHIPVRVDEDAVRWDLTHTLVVATRTVNSPDLIARLKERAAERPHRFTFICPRSGDFGREQVVGGLARTLAEMYREEIDSTGQPMSPEPLPAIQNAIEHYRVDDILISTLKGQQSRWLEQGLIDKVRAITDKPVEHIESSDRAAPEPEREPAAAGAEAS